MYLWNRTKAATRQLQRQEEFWVTGGKYVRPTAQNVSHNSNLTLRSYVEHRLPSSLVKHGSVHRVQRQTNTRLAPVTTETTEQHVHSPQLHVRTSDTPNRNGNGNLSLYHSTPNLSIPSIAQAPSGATRFNMHVKNDDPPSLSTSSRTPILPIIKPTSYLSSNAASRKSSREKRAVSFADDSRDHSYRYRVYYDDPRTEVSTTIPTPSDRVDSTQVVHDTIPRCNDQVTDLYHNKHAIYESPLEVRVTDSNSTLLPTSTNYNDSEQKKLVDQLEGGIHSQVTLTPQPYLFNPIYTTTCNTQSMFDPTDGHKASTPLSVRIAKRRRDTANKESQFKRRRSHPIGTVDAAVMTPDVKNSSRLALSSSYPYYYSTQRSMDDRLQSKTFDLAQERKMFDALTRICQGEIKDHSKTC